MIGRLGMTGSSVTRGDSAIYKAMSTPAKVGYGAAAVAGAAGVGYSASPAGRRQRAKAKVMGQAYRGSADFRAMSRDQRKAFADAYVGKLFHPPVPRAKSGSPKHLIEAHRAQVWDSQTRGQSGVSQAHQGFIRELEALPAARTSKKRAGVLVGAGAAGGVGVAVPAARRKSGVAKAAKRDYSGAAVGSGAVLGTAGLAAGGIPGVKSNRIMVDVKSAPGVRAKAANLAGAYRGGEFGYRHNAHHTFKTFGLSGEVPKNATRAEHFAHGDKTGRVAAEDKIIRHLKTGRKVSNAALVGGTALVAGGIHQRRKQVAKRDDFKADVAAASGATTALGAGGISRVLDHQGRKWSKQAANSHDLAQTLNPKLGGHDVKQTKTRVPDVVPHRSKMKNTVQHKTIFAGRSNQSAEAAGHLKGVAAQSRYFAHTYGTAAQYARKASKAGAVVAAAGVGAKVGNAKRQEMAKADDTARRAAKAAGRATQAAKARTIAEATQAKIAQVPKATGPNKAWAALGGAAIVGGGALTVHVNSKGYKRQQAYELAHLKARKATLQSMAKAETTMSDEQAAKLAGKYDTRGPLPKKMTREAKMQAYEARYIHSGGKKGERYKRKAQAAEVGRTVGLGAATVSAAGILGHRGKKTGKILSKVPHLTSHNLEAAGLAGAAGGGASEMYGAYARNRRASYANSPAGVAGSALTRMQAYTPRQPGAKT